MWQIKNLLLLSDQLLKIFFVMNILPNIMIICQSNRYIHYVSLCFVKSCKLFYFCRQSRRWMYESCQVQGTDEVYSNQYLDHWLFTIKCFLYSKYLIISFFLKYISFNIFKVLNFYFLSNCWALCNLAAATSCLSKLTK